MRFQVQVRFIYQPYFNDFTGSGGTSIVEEIPFNKNEQIKKWPACTDVIIPR